MWITLISYLTGKSKNLIIVGIAILAGLSVIAFIYFKFHNLQKELSITKQNYQTCQANNLNLLQTLQNQNDEILRNQNTNSVKTLDDSLQKQQKELTKYATELNKKIKTCNDALTAYIKLWNQ